jgi:hypothetical protein
MEYNYPYNIQQTQSTGKIFGISIMFFLIGILITFFVLYLIYEYVLKEKKIQPIEPIQKIIDDIKKIIKIPENDLNIDDSIDKECLQKRKIYDSDFDRTTYPINDIEIIYF